MRLTEFYNPEQDQMYHRSVDDTRKSKMTLKELNKLRKYRDIKRKEKVEHNDFVRIMYASAPDAGSGI